MGASDSYCPLCQSDDHEEGAKNCIYDGTPLRAKRDRGAEWIGKDVDGKYRVLRFVDAGGTAEVYEVERLGSASRRLALKLLHKTLSGDSELLQQFRQEARLVSLIAHPNVVAIQDFGTLPGDVHYMVMELLDGRSLAAELDGRPMAPLRALRFAMQACEGLAAAHQREVLHCDIKPANFFLQAEGEGEPVLKILDLGIGRFAHAESGPGGRIAGTPDYMSPEQCRGQSLGHGADIYSMGVVLFEMLLGQMPFAADSPLELLEMHVSVPAAWPHALAASLGVPPAAEAVVMKALAKDPAERQASMLDLQQELSALTRQLRAVGTSGASMRPRISRVPQAVERSSVSPSLAPAMRGSAAPPGGARESRAEVERPRVPIVELDPNAAPNGKSARASSRVGRSESPGQAVILEIWDGMLVLGVDGSLDARRVAAMAERVRGEVERRRADSVLIDASALASVDGSAREQLRFLAAAIGRPGVYCVLTGIRGEGDARAEGDGLPAFRTLVDGITACMRERELRR